MSYDYDSVEPSFKGYQLIGDSQFLRFSEQLLHKQRQKRNGVAYIGLCVSGQKSGDLCKRIKEDFYPTSNKAILMIGTNDLLQCVEYEKMEENLRAIVLELISRGVEKLIILTVPPVPRLANSYGHWNTLKQYNNRIKKLNNDVDIFVVDIYKKLVRENDRNGSGSSSPSFSSSSRNSSPALSRRSSLHHIFNSNKTISANSSVNSLSGLRIQFSNSPSPGIETGVKRKVYCLEDDENERNSQNESERNSQNDSYDSQSNIGSPPAKRRSYSSSFLADDDNNDRFCDEDSRPSNADEIRLECFEESYSGSTRKDLIHLNYKGLRLIRDLILDTLPK